MKGTLYLVPNTLGEEPAASVLPEEVIRIAARLDYYIVENAKSARAFLKRVGAQHPLTRPIQEIEMRELNVATSEASWPRLLEPLLAGRDAGLVSEAGCPAVADPGAGLVALAHLQGIRVRPLVGPSSILLALMASGLNGQQFAFAGYLPADVQSRKEAIGKLEQRSRALTQTQIVIETPHRNNALFAALAAHLDDQTRLCVASDLTLATENVCTQRTVEWRKSPPRLDRRPTIFLFQA